MKKILFEAVTLLEPEMTAFLSELVSYPAICPVDGGRGEGPKAQFIIRKIEELGLGEPEIVSAPDDKAEGGARPNILLRIPGRSNKRLWIISHMDVVPVGDISLWNTDPFEAVVRDGCIFARGANDNGQELAASLYAAAALKKCGVTPEYEVCLCMVADEEVGSDHGIKYLIRQGLFNADDLIVVPDGGCEDGSFIEIAEKSILWIEFEVIGKQAHGSMPHVGNNACRAANELSVSLDSALHRAFPDEDKLFSPDVSTFEPTRRMQNVENINTIPGRERFSFDCRVLPGISLDTVVSVVDAEVKKIERKFGVTVSYVFPQKVQAPQATPEDAEVVELLKRAVAEVIPVALKVGGIGGGTCAAYFREVGIPAVVWDQEADVAHMPNEYARIEHMVNEAKVFAFMMAGGAD